ncbi:MAG: cupin domain-containing protein [Actinobacteria bacterium]|nr:cupin domain-containing protein [Actinomycetota bacterium]
MAHVQKNSRLPKLHSTRDTRDRIDLVTTETFGTTDLKADRITYHPGDTAAAHRHPDCKHFFFVLDGKGVLHAEDEEIDLASGDVVMLDEDEVHWFENRSDTDFEFIELWVPAPPTPTVWVSDDQCTWAPNT